MSPAIPGQTIVSCEPLPYNNRNKESIMQIKSLCPLLGFLALLFLLAGCEGNDKTAQAPPPPEIPVYITKAEEVPIYQEFVGQVYGSKDIAIRARVEGFLEGIHFQEGSVVAAGDLLYTIDSQPFEATVAASMSKVAEAKTLLAKATSDLNRIRPLAEQNAVSQSDLDGAVAAYKANQSNLEAARANLRATEIQLGYTKVYSPINGIIGKTKAKVGDFVGREPNPVILNTVSNVERVLVEFFLTENEYLTLARRYFAEQEKTQLDEKDLEKGPDLELILADGSVYPHKGKGEFLDREVDRSTGAILVQASFPNPNSLIRPGQFAKIKIAIDNIKNGILVPQRCVSELQGRFRVFVVDDQNKVTERQVQPGPTIDNFWLIRDGLKTGEKVVYEGMQFITEGAEVKPVATEVERINPNEQ